MFFSVVIISGFSQLGIEKTLLFGLLSVQVADKFGYMCKRLIIYETRTKHLLAMAVVDLALG